MEVIFFESWGASLGVACLRTSSLVLLAAFWVFASFEHDLGFRVPYLNTFFWTSSLKEPTEIKRLIMLFSPWLLQSPVVWLDGSPPKSESPEKQIQEKRAQEFQGQWSALKDKQKEERPRPETQNP